MARKLVIGIVLIALVVVSGFAFFTLNKEVTENFSSMNITFYDADDNIVYETSSEALFPPFLFKNVDGNIIDHVKVEISYTATAKDVDFDTISVKSTLTVTTRVTPEDEEDPLEEVNKISESPRYFVTYEDSYEVTYTMAQLIPNPDEANGKSLGWSILFSLHLDATGKRSGEPDIVTSANDKIAFGVGWVPDAVPYFSIEASVIIRD